MNARLLAALFAFVGATLSSQSAFAHANGASYLSVTELDRAASVRWAIPAGDLQLPLELDADGDGELSSMELDERRAALVRFTTQRLTLQRGGSACTLQDSALATEQREELFVVLTLRAACETGGPLAVSSQLYFGSPGYSTLVDAYTSTGRFRAALSMRSPQWRTPERRSPFADLAQFIGEGVWHVLIGYDHVVFLLLLLLPAVLRESSGAWTAAASLREVARDLLKIITGFTIAHSITLGLAATGAVHLPTQPIEIAIAASIIVAGLLNLKAAAARIRFPLAFAFGLIHGFGFANALRDIDAEGAHIAALLGGFNVGVELAQLGIVAAALPLLWASSRSAVYASRVMPALSIAAAVSGAAWFVQRL